MKRYVFRKSFLGSFPGNLGLSLQGQKALGLTKLLCQHIPPKPHFSCPFFHRFGECGVGEGWSGWAFIPIHLPSFPCPPHHPPQPLLLFSAMISSLMEKMLSHISHFQCVGVTDSSTKIWTIKPSDSFRVCPRSQDLILEEELIAHGVWKRVLQVVGLERMMERRKASFTLPYLGCKAFFLFFPQIQCHVSFLGRLRTKSHKILAASGFAVVLGISPAAAHRGICFGASPPSNIPTLGTVGLCCSRAAVLPRAAAERARSTSPGG